MFSNIVSDVSVEDIDNIISSYDEDCSLTNTFQYYEIAKSVIERYVSGKNVIEILKKPKKIFGSKIKSVVDTYALKHRNEKWKPKILKAFNNYNNIFVAAGLFHFIYNDNLLDMLKKEGFFIKRFKANCK